VHVKNISLENQTEKLAKLTRKIPVVFFAFTISLILFSSACKNSPPIHSRTPDGFFPFLTTAKDSSYGYHPENAIRVGSSKKSRRKMTLEQHATTYLKSLPTPDHRPIQFQLVGFCCEFFHPEAFAGIATLQVYRIQHPKWPETRTLFIDVWQADTLKIPVGFSP
jgi:hypothetical protein